MLLYPVEVGWRLGYRLRQCVIHPSEQGLDAFVFRIDLEWISCFLNMMSWRMNYRKGT